MNELISDAFIDITDVECPVTFIKAQIAIDKIKDGQTLEIRLNGGRPLEHVPRTLQCEGHEILGSFDNQDGTFTVFMKKSKPLYGLKTGIVFDRSLQGGLK
jgi:tRNA 2-thiouridine synthesizing protein A